MSDVQTRPAASRGRGSGRGGRGGFASRGGRSTAGRPNGQSKPDSKPEVDNPSAFDDEEDGAIGDLKKKYGAKTTVIKEMFPEWSEVDILFALQETDGDETEAATRIAEGSISQWGEVSKSKKAPRSKTKDTPAPFADSSANIPRQARGGRNVSEGGRGRGRATERGSRGGARGRSSHTAATNGARAVPKENQPLSVPTEESTAWEKPADGAANSSIVSAAVAASAAAAADEDTSKIATGPVSNAPKTWASMLRQSTVPKPVAKPKETTAPTKQAADAIEPLPPVASTTDQVEDLSSSNLASNAVPEPIAADVHDATAEVPTVIEPEVALVPSKDQLTETNLEQVVDESHPPATATVASTAADSWDPRLNAASATATPLSAAQQQHQATRPPMHATSSSGYATSALKATTERAGRTPSYQRRVLDQEEAVRMPGNREVDRAAVQFGAFNLGTEEDVDGDREDAETRAQPPADSPIAHPRASLPPAMPQTAVPDAFAAQKAAAAGATHATPTGPSSGSPPPRVRLPVVNSGANGISPAIAHATASQPPSHPAAQAQQAAVPQTQIPGQYSRYGQTGAQESSSFTQKPLDPFAQQAGAAAAAATAAPPQAAQGHMDGFSSQPSAQQAQQSQQQQHQQQPGGGAFGSTHSDYSSYYGSDHQGRTPYNYYGQQQQQQQQHQQQQHYGQHANQGHQEGASGQQRGYGSYNSSQAENLSQYPQSGATLPNQTRYGGGVSSDSHNSGHTTPNPTAQSQQQQQQPTQPQQQQQGAGAGAAQTSQPQSHAQQSYPYGSHPYYNNPYYSNYMGYAGHFGQGGYGAGPYGKGGMYGQPYGMSPQGPYDHGSSPASGFGQSSLHRGDSGLSSGLASELGRAGSAQSGNPSTHGSAGFGGMQDTFGARGGSFPSQAAAGQGFNAAGQPSNAATSADELKAFNDAKAGAGPSPSIGGAARPGSATQNTPSSQAGLPGPGQSAASQMGGYGGYPSHLQGNAHGLHGASSYGMGASGQHGNAGFASYGQGYGGAGYYGSGGQQQQQRGWGGNYH